jgi:ABC-type transport system substrate-binding protein
VIKSALSCRAFLRRATLCGISAAAPVKPSAAPADGAATAAPVAAMPDQAQGALRAALDAPVKLDPAFASSGGEIAILNTVYDYLVDKVYHAH